MKKINIDVSGLVSVLSDLGVEKRLIRVPGIVAAHVEYATQSASVTYDETVTDLDTIKAAVRDRARANDVTPTPTCHGVRRCCKGRQRFAAFCRLPATAYRQQEAR